MDMYLQFGYGMMSIADDLLRSWKGGGVLLSPRDLEPDQLEKVAKSASKSSAEVLLDPQCYVHAADHKRLTSHDYWGGFGGQKTANLISTKNVACLKILYDLNISLGCGAFILPGLYAETLNDLWWAFHEEQLKGAIELGVPQSSIMPTLALSSAVVESESAVDEISERVKGWDVERLYVVLENTSSYLTESPLWLTGALQLSAALKLVGKKLLIGYCNHQLLPLACAGVDAIASGTWLNVRAFQPEKFMISSDEEVSRRAKGGWYYCPQTLSEYKMPMLDVALRRKVLSQMAPVPDEGHAAPLFSGVQPSLVNWGERNAFLHYLSTLHAQCRLAGLDSYDKALKYHRVTLGEAKVLAQHLRDNGVRGNDRDFFDLIDVSLSALDMLDSSYGAKLRHSMPNR